MLNPSKGNMFDFTNFTYNVVKGACPHACSYCYLKRFYNETNPQPQMHFDEKELSTDLGNGNFIFVGSSFDLFADAVPSEWIEKVIKHCAEFDNTYLFQTKNPKRFFNFSFLVPQ